MSRPALLALICVERTRETRRLQSSSAPRVPFSPQGEQRELEQRRTVVRNYTERLRAGSSPAPVSGSSARKGPPGAGRARWRVLHPGRIEGRSPASLVILSQLQIVVLAVHADSDVPNDTPGVQPSAKCPEGPVIRGHGARDEPDSSTQELATGVEHGLLDHLVRPLQ